MIQKIFIAMLLGVALFSSIPLENALPADNQPDKPLVLIKKQYAKDLEKMELSIRELSELSKSLKEGQGTTEQLQSHFLNTRLQFKRLEFLLDYFDPFLVVKSINGAPLPKLEPNIPEINVIQPNGLQRLDELIFSENPKAEVEDIIHLSTKLEKVFEQTKAYQLRKQFQHRYVFEALRYGVIRLYTLGLTGFDTPGSVHAIPDAIAATKSMQESFQIYQNITPAAQIEAWENINNLFKNSLTYLENNNDFDTFDRLFFLKTYTNPLYAALYGFQKTLNIEFSEEVDQTLSAHNYHSQNLFDKQFFNPSFFTEIAESDLNDSKKIELGKILFFDPILSRNMEMSCASCHHPEKAFTDGLPKSKSNRPGKFTRRNSPTLVNVTYSTRYFLDLREYDLERQIKHVMHDSLEFNMDFLDAAERLKGSATYMQLFKDAYGKRDKYGISTWSISNALAAYVNSLTSFNSPFDQYVKGQQKELAADIKKGYNLFMGKAACGTCHFAPVFNGTVPPYYQDSESEVLGVLMDFDTLNPVLDGDLGRLSNGLPEEEAAHFAHSFKTVTLRNIALTAPYMHNGSMETLEEVMDFYNRGGGAGMGLDLPHQTLPDTPLNLNPAEIKSIIAFMESLTDIADFQDVPTELPRFEKHPEWNKRKLYND
jgi:cytochrome c peroxidase